MKRKRLTPMFLSNFSNSTSGFSKLPGMPQCSLLRDRDTERSANSFECTKILNLYSELINLYFHSRSSSYGLGIFLAE